jgi:MFS family permease
MNATDTEARITVPRQGSAAHVPVRPPFLKVRLAVLMFLAFMVMGAWMPVFTLFLKKLGFTPDQTAWASATNAIGSMIAPLLWGQIADRWLAKERCISLCALMCGILLWLLADVTQPALMIAGCIALWFFLIPVIGLSGAFIFRQLAHPERDYGQIRLWGTIGWMAANWGLTAWFEIVPGVFGSSGDQTPDLADSMRLGALAAFAVTLYALTMPHAPPSRMSAGGRGWRARLVQAVDAPRCTLRLFRRRSFFVYSACMFGFYVTVSFTQQLNPLLLDKLGVDEKMVPLYLTICQVLEVAFLAILPLLLTKFGTKATMTLGAGAWTVGLFLLSVGQPVGLVLTALSASGAYICCFVISGQVFVNRQATPDIRASAQGLLVFFNGAGLLVGHLLVGWIRDWTGDHYDVAYRIAALVSAALFVLFVAGFTTASATENSPRETLVPDSEIS